MLEQSSMHKLHILAFINPYTTATNNIGQKYNGPEYNNKSIYNIGRGLVYNTIEFKQWAGTWVRTINVIERYPMG